jgi:hypothetical protein
MTDAPATAVEMFTARCEARALLCHVGELTLQDAVDGCQQHAEAHGLVAAISQDAVQAIIAAAFAPLRDDTMVPSPIDQPASELPGGAASTIDAAEYLLRENDADRWRAWLAKHSEAECAAILNQIERQQRKAG